MLNKIVSWLFLPIAVLPTLCCGQDSLLLKISKPQLSVINGTREYAVGCKVVKDQLFSAVDTARSIIKLQYLQINALDSLNVVLGAKYNLMELEAANQKKQAKKAHFKQKANAALFYTASAVAGVMAVLYVLK